MSQQFSNTARRFQHRATDPANPKVGDVIVNSNDEVLRVCLADGAWSDVSTGGGGAAPYLVYTALLTQSGTDAPVATVLQNTLGGTIAWTRGDVGSYQGNLSGSAAFADRSKVFIIIAHPESINSLSSARWAGASGVDIATSLIQDPSDGGPISVDDLLDHTSLEIRVYQP